MREINFPSLPNRSNCVSFHIFSFNYIREMQNDISSLFLNFCRWVPLGKPGHQKKQPCVYCGLVGTHPEGKNCPVYGKRCTKCQTFNHFSIACRADTSKDNKKTPQHRCQCTNRAGAEVNVMDEHQFKALKNRTRERITLAPSRTKLYILQGELPVKGEFTATIRN